MGSSIKIVFTDLDGTLLDSRRMVSQRNRDCLAMLGQKNIVRVISTGRSYYSYQSVMTDDFPADYLIVSNGAGILDLATGELLTSFHLEHPDISIITTYLSNQGTSFMVHDAVPDNHSFVYYQSPPDNPDFTRRLSLYHQFARAYSSPASLPAQSAQIIAIFNQDLEHFRLVQQGLQSYQVTRTTSPLDGLSIWMEISAHHVSKGKSAAWLCRRLQIAQTDTLGIGNDFNDISLLDYTEHSFVVENSPNELHRHFCLTRSNDDNGFSEAVLEALS